MKSRGILVFLTVVMTVLYAAGRLFPGDGIDIGSAHLRFTDLHTLVEKRRATEQRHSDVTAASVPVTLEDSIAFYRLQVDSSELRFWMPNPHYFDSFWQAAEQARGQGRTVRILHYGDSQIEMDHMTSRLRSYMQSTYGGGGPGMVPFRTITPTLSVRQSTSGALTHLSSFGDSLVVRSSGNYGPMMQSFRLDGGNATVTIKGSTSNLVDDRVKKFSRVKVILNNRSNASVSFSNLRNGREQRHKSSDQCGLMVSDFVLDSSTTAFNVAVSGVADIYCLLVDDGSGVAVDNIPMRGCSGQQFTLVGTGMLGEAYRLMDVGMVIMQFGGNSVPYIRDTKAITTYCRSIAKQIDHVKNCCPGAKVLFIGPSDMSHRHKGELQTYSILPQLIDSLAATATAHGAAYWSIYHAMGGWNSMPQWSNKGFAGKDYIHFSQKGADMMGDKLAKAFDNSHKLYRMERRRDKAMKNKEVHSKRGNGGRR